MTLSEIELQHWVSERQKMFTSYRRSRGGSTIHRIRTHITFWTKLVKSSTQCRPTNSGVNSNNLIKINIQQTVLKQIPNIISLNVINAQSICGPNGKTEDFIDHIAQSHVDICVVTETFLTEQNNVTCAALHLPGYVFLDQPRSNGAARGGIGVFYRDSFKLSKLSHTERRSFELFWKSCFMAPLLHETMHCLSSTIFNLPPYYWCHIHAWIRIIPWWNSVGQWNAMHPLGISTYALMIQMTHMVVSLTIYYQATVLLTMSLSQHIRLVTLSTWLLHEIIKSWNLDQSSLDTFCLITVSSVQI